MQRLIGTARHGLASLIQVYPRRRSGDLGPHTPALHPGSEFTIHAHTRKPQLKLSTNCTDRADKQAAEKTTNQTHSPCGDTTNFSNLLVSASIRAIRGFQARFFGVTGSRRPFTLEKQRGRMASRSLTTRANGVALLPREDDSAYGVKTMPAVVPDLRATISTRRWISSSAVRFSIRASSTSRAESKLALVETSFSARRASS